MSLKHHIWKNITRFLFHSLLPLFLSTFVLSSCATGNAVTLSPTPSSTLETPETFTPPALPKDSNQVLYLTNKTASVANVSGTFYAKKPFTIFAICTWSGTLYVQLNPSGLSTFSCSQRPQLQGNDYGNAQHPPTPENIHVQVKAQGNATWEVSVQWQI